jgi:hypothetical protein
MKGLSVTPGAPDVLLRHAGKSFAIELKSETGRVTDSQIQMLDRLSETGCYAAICHGLDRVLSVLESRQLLRGHMQ